MLTFKKLVIRYKSARRKTLGELEYSCYNNDMDIEGQILNGYLRLYCKIKGIPPLPPRCRKCGAELDAGYKKRKAGYLCLKCYHQRNAERKRLFYERNPDKIKNYVRNYNQRNPHKPFAWGVANYNHKERQQCQVIECRELGVRHHEDYYKPKEIIWLCPLHHKQLHRGELSLDKICI